MDAPTQHAENLQPELLYDRVAANRRKMRVFLVGFVAATSALVSASITLVVPLMFAAVFVVDASGPGDIATAGTIAHVSLIAFVGLFLGLIVPTSAYVAVSQRNARARIAGSLRTIPVATGDPRFAVTRQAFADAIILTGFTGAPPVLYALPEALQSVNAAAFGRRSDEIGVAVTFGFAERLPLAQQRALLTALLARAASGVTFRETAFGAIMSPLVGIRNSEHAFDGDPTGFVQTVWVSVAFSAKILGLALERGSLLGAETSDAEAMLALREPVAMLDALESLATADTSVPLDRVTAMLFVAPVDGSPAVTSAELARVRRMREVLGAEGAPLATRAHDAADVGGL